MCWTRCHLQIDAEASLQIAGMATMDEQLASIEAADIMMLLVEEQGCFAAC